MTAIAFYVGYAYRTRTLYSSITYVQYTFYSGRWRTVAPGHPAEGRKLNSVGLDGWLYDDGISANGHPLTTTNRYRRRLTLFGSTFYVVGPPTPQGKSAQLLRIFVAFALRVLYNAGRMLWLTLLIFWFLRYAWGQTNKQTNRQTD